MQQTGPSLSSAWDLVLTSSVETKVVLVVIAAFSLISWFIIGSKWWQFRRLKSRRIASSPSWSAPLALRMPTMP